MNVLRKIFGPFVPYCPRSIRKFYYFIKRQLFTLYSRLFYPANKFSSLFVDKSFLPTRTEKNRPIRRLLEYNHSLLPNSYIADLESKSVDTDPQEMKTLQTGDSPGYPAWNLLYYTLLCSLPGKDEQEAVIVETGTNRGFSTIIMAQAIKDAGIRGYVHSVDIEEKMVALARENIEKAGLSEFVKFYTQDSLLFLDQLVRKVKYINFAFIDGNHTYEYIRKEFAIIYPRILACRGKVYFDNTMDISVDKALHFIKHAYGGDALEFRNCSWFSPGNAIWQPGW